MMMNENCGNGVGNGGGSVGGDESDSSSEFKVCRDFMRNVCQRGNNCRFIHPENTKIRTDPIFCHDFQQGRCFRTNCKFIHCNREEEEHYKMTGELPPGVHDPDAGRVIFRTNNGNGAVQGQGRGGMRVMKNNRGPPIRNGSSHGNGDHLQDEIPMCKDFLKGVCDRPPGGCKFRHVTPRGPIQGVVTRTPFARVAFRGRGGHMMQTIPTRRKVMCDMYDEGPDAKRYQMEEYSGYEEYDVIDEYVPIPPPPPPRGIMGGTQVRYMNNYPTTTTYSNLATYRNGYQADSLPFYNTSSHSDAMKALEDENFMLKRRIEELKSSNEFLLNQNAQLRLNNSLSVGTSVATVQPLSVSTVTVSGAGHSAQPNIIGITSSSLSATQPLPTISISALPTVSSLLPPVSISQALQPQPQTQTQIYIPTPNQGIN